jgi:hypothetical protein
VSLPGLSILVLSLHGCCPSSFISRPRPSPHHPLPSTHTPTSQNNTHKDTAQLTHNPPPFLPPQQNQPSNQPPTGQRKHWEKGLLALGEVLCRTMGALFVAKQIKFLPLRAKAERHVPTKVTE